MSRYYKIILTPPSGSTGKPITWTSHPNGLMQPPDPGALNIKFDVIEASGYNPASNFIITIEGVSLTNLMQGTQFGAQKTKPGWGIQLFIGMGKGLPLANPKQAGLIIKGQVLESWGNWEGTEMNLSLYVTGGTTSDPPPIVHDQPASTPLGQTIKNSIQTAFPGVPTTMNISPNLVWNFPLVGFYRDLDSYARMLKDLTIGFGGNKKYRGVDIGFSRGGITVFDGSNPTSPIALAFTDFIGQPTWIMRGGIVQAKFQARADIQMNSMVTFPAGMVAAPGMSQMTEQAYPYGGKMTFTGKFQAISLRHVGNFRMRDGASWATIIQFVPQGAAAT